MSFSIFNSGYYQSKETLSVPIDSSPHKDIHEIYPNEKSFLSDFNIEEELFAGMGGSGAHQGFNGSAFDKNRLSDGLLPMSNRGGQIHPDAKQMRQQQPYAQQIPHKNNEMFNKLVGTKRRKLANSKEQDDQELKFEYLNDPKMQNMQGIYSQQQYIYENRVFQPQTGHQNYNKGEYESQVNINSSSSMMDPTFLPNPKHLAKRHSQDENTRTGGCTGGATSYQSSIRALEHDNYTDQDDNYYITNESGASLIDTEDFKKIKKRMQNKESAVRSRMKKKAYYDQMESQFNNISQENNKLKLDNAALRAENQLLKRYLNYFEILFAKKTTQPSPMNPLTNSTKDSISTHGGYTPAMHSNPSSRCGGLSDDEIYNGKQQLYPFNIRKRQHMNRNQASLQGGLISSHHDEVYSQMSADNEASRGVISSKKDIKSAKDVSSEVSFVLARKGNESTGSSSPGKFGMFTIALVMCVCCFSSFFSAGGSDDQIGSTTRYNGLGRNIMGFNGNKAGVDASLNNNQVGSDDIVSQGQNNQQTASVVVQYSLICWSNFLKIMFLVFFAVLVLTFPLDDIKQWAARKSWLRKIFSLNDIPLQASKNIKNL